MDDCIGIIKILMGTDSSDGEAKIVLSGYYEDCTEQNDKQKVKIWRKSQLNSVEQLNECKERICTEIKQYKTFNFYDFLDF